MTHTDTKSAKMLERVRALLAKADGTNFPAEAETFRAKADELMTLYAIEQWQVENAQAGVDAKPELERRDFNFEWWYSNSRSSELWSLFYSVAYHCRCVVAIRGHNYKRMPIIGLPSDLDYFDMLFTHLMLDMAKQLEPKPDPSKSFDENAYILRAAGTQRVRTIEMLYNAGMIPGTDPETFTWEMIYNGTPGQRGYFRELPGYPKDKQLRVKVRTAAERWAKANGLDSTTQDDPRVWQRSFAQGYVREIDYRMGATERKREDPTGSMALAVRDIRAQASALYNELFPPPEDTGKKSRSVVRSSDVAFSDRAYNTGKVAGSKANISRDARRGVGGNKKELSK